MTSPAKLVRATVEFVVGEDWRIALGVAAGLGITALLSEAGLAAWWVMPVATVLLLALSIRRAAQDTLDTVRRESPGEGP